ncbi:MAG: membrane dipeptidase [Nitrospira sp.]|nr:membrane dipeptidase [Nitrospira sp.]
MGLSVTTGQPRVLLAAARKLYRRAMIVDGNLAPCLDDVIPQPSATLTLHQDSGLTAIKITIGGAEGTFESTLEDIAFYLRVMEPHSDVFMQIRCVNDFAVAKRKRRLGLIFSFEGIEMMEGKIERIQLFRDFGVRVMQLSYNTTSPFGAGVLTSPLSGLTALGAQAVEEMHTSGIAIDLSHSNRQTTFDVIDRSKRPVLMTHAGCAAVHMHPRNKTDDELRAVAATGGVVGIYMLPYLTAAPRQPTLDDYLAHMCHALKVCGEDHVGIGSDTTLNGFDPSPENMARFNQGVAYRKAKGIGAPEEDRPILVEGLNTSRRCEVIADALLARGYPIRITEKVLGANFIRTFTDVWGS